ncbi:homeobox protein koza-like isoform X2 [Tachypleus tridentatus]|uniref:homeobox protein koza-like isoform X2 n=1 Tax=Tachypleus tridentatus TaxID=6853 RepID=UPI003FD530F5
MKDLVIGTRNEMENFQDYQSESEETIGRCHPSEERKKRQRTAFTSTQIKTLESEFERNRYLSVSKRMQLSKTLKLTETQISLSPAWPGGSRRSTRNPRVAGSNHPSHQTCYFDIC